MSKVQNPMYPNFKLPVSSAPFFEESDTNASEVVARLYEDVLYGVFKPGERLRSDDLRERYHASVGSIREALSRLTALGIVNSQPGRGFRAAPVSIEDLQDITQMRVDLEAKALTDSISHGDVDWEASLIAAQHLLASVPVPAVGDSIDAWTEWRVRHANFHAAAVAACRSPWLKHFRSIMFDHSERYRIYKVMSLGTKARTPGEHLRLMEVILSRDVDAAVKMMTEHILKSSTSIEKLMRQVKAT